MNDKEKKEKVHESGLPKPAPAQLPHHPDPKDSHAPHLELDDEETPSSE